MRGEDRIDAGQGVHVDEGGKKIAVRRHVGADVGQRLDAQAKNTAVGVQSELGVADVVARMFIRQDGLAALAGPLDRASELSRCPWHQAVLGVLPTLGAETAADVVGDHADAVLGDLEDVLGQRVAHAVRVLHVGPDRVAAVAFIVAADHAARLHVVRVDPADHVAAFDHPRGFRECGIRVGGVAGLEHVGDVVRAFVPDRRRAGRDRLRGVGYRR